MPTHKHPDQAEPDSHFEWISPDESTRMEFIRDRPAVLQMASELELVSRICSKLGRKLLSYLLLR